MRADAADKHTGGHHEPYLWCRLPERIYRAGYPRCHGSLGQRDGRRALVLYRVKTDYFRHRGKDSAMEMSVALANSGDPQIELIQQRNDAPSMYKELLDSGREGLQHMS